MEGICNSCVCVKEDNACCKNLNTTCRNRKHNKNSKSTEFIQNLSTEKFVDTKQKSPIDNNTTVLNIHKETTKFEPVCINNDSDDDIEYCRNDSFVDYKDDNNRENIQTHKNFYDNDDWQLFIDAHNEYIGNFK